MYIPVIKGEKNDHMCIYFSRYVFYPNNKVPESLKMTLES